jgi:protein-tyrosine phosphatase
LVVIVAPILGIAAYLWWQSTIKPAPFDVMFEVRESDPLRVSRVEDGWAITASDGLKPAAIRVGSSPNALDAFCAVTAVNGHYHAAAQRHPYPRGFFEIELEDGQTVRTAERVLPLEGPTNFRDLGGYETMDGRCVAWGRVYRADGLDRLTRRDRAILQELGIQMLCDLRTYAEVEARPDPALEGIAYRHMPVFAKDPISRAAAIFNRHRLDIMFRRFYQTTIVDSGAPALGEVLRLAADPRNLPLVFHCAAGKDRTGVTAALLLYICGVPRGTIIADYTLSNLGIEKSLAYIRKGSDRAKLHLGFKIEHMYPVLSARPELIEQTFDYIDTTYGSIDQYLFGPVVLTNSDLDAIRRNLLERQSETATLPHLPQSQRRRAYNDAPSAWRS